MEVLAHGFDTVRACYQLSTPLPTTDSEFQLDMVKQGWDYRSKVFLKDGDFIGSNTFTFQHPENDSLRVMLYASDRLVTEFSAPRICSQSGLNNLLVSKAQLPHALDVSERLIKDVLPTEISLTHRNYPRLDYSVDVAAGDAKSALISASSQFNISGVRKTARQLFPGETGKCWSRYETFRGYCKFTESLAKLSTEDQKMHAETLQMMKDSGYVRLERASRIKSGYASAYPLVAAHDFAKYLSDGFKGGVFTVGSLATIRQQIWAMENEDGKPISAQRRNSLYTFAALYAELGEPQAREYFTRRTFFRRKKQFLESGLRLEDVTTYDREIDLTPVFEVLRAA